MMASSSNDKYSMTLSLNVLKHLGFGLYSNVPAVLSEAVANAWDADAEHVWIEIDPQAERITIQDDGHGMTVDDVNEKYLYVGYERRKVKDGARSPRLDRPVMGRKGIGKLSLFSIAKTVEIHSVRNGDRHGFIMDAERIEEVIKSENEDQYHPKSVEQGQVQIDFGTKITLTNIKRRLDRSGSALRRRLARRFSIIGSINQFQIAINSSPVTIEDRGYHDKVQYIWTFGPLGQEVGDSASILEHRERRSGSLTVDDSEFNIDGWIGTATAHGQLKDSDGSSINKLVLMVRGKLAQEDILEEFGEGGLYSKYVIGEVHADFLDLDDHDDIATTSRQRIIEDDPRYRALKDKLRSELKMIEGQWTDLRDAQGEQVAVEIPQIRQWYRNLHDDHRVAARRLFGRINRLPIDSASEKRQLFISGILAFESLKLRNLLYRLDNISAENLSMLSEVFVQLDDLEASAYYNIARDRLKVIQKLTDLVDEQAKERALQEHLYKHLWLLDPSWERATATERMETSILTAVDGKDYPLNPQQMDEISRFDICYSTTGNKHVVIELKRASRVLGEVELYGQIRKYHRAAKRVLRQMDQGTDLEIIAVIGEPLREWGSSDEAENEFRESIRAFGARIVMYDSLIENALRAYQDYVDKRREAGRIYDLVMSIEEEDAAVINQG